MTLIAAVAVAVAVVVCYVLACAGPVVCRGGGRKALNWGCVLQ